MDIKELDKRQLILLTLLITFVVSIATGIITVSLMNQMPKSIPQTINNVIQRTIEKVSTAEIPALTDTASSTDSTKGSSLFIGDGEVVVSVYLKEDDLSAPSGVVPGVDQTTSPESTGPVSANQKELGQGIIISDVGLVLVDSSVLTESKVYKVVLNKIDFDATVLKNFTNGFTVLKISEKKSVEKTPVAVPAKTN